MRAGGDSAAATAAQGHWQVQRPTPAGARGRGWAKFAEYSFNGERSRGKPGERVAFSQHLASPQTTSSHASRHCGHLGSRPALQSIASSRGANARLNCRDATCAPDRRSSQMSRPPQMSSTRANEREKGGDESDGLLISSKNSGAVSHHGWSRISCALGRLAGSLSSMAVIRSLDCWLQLPPGSAKQTRIVGR